MTEHNLRTLSSQKTPQILPLRVTCWVHTHDVLGDISSSCDGNAVVLLLRITPWLKPKGCHTNCLNFGDYGIVTCGVNPRLDKRPLKINGRLANRELISLVKEATLAALSGTTALVLCYCSQGIAHDTSSNGNIFRVTGPLCGEFTGPRWIPAQRPVTRSFDVFCHLRVNNRKAGDLRRYLAHYGVTVMINLKMGYVNCCNSKYGTCHILVP